MFYRLACFLSIFFMLTGNLNSQKKTAIKNKNKHIIRNKAKFDKKTKPVVVSGQKNQSSHTPKKDTNNKPGDQKPKVIIIEKKKKKYKIRNVYKRIRYRIRKKGFRIEEKQGRRYAITVGINDYNDTGISDLRKARNDAKVIGKIFKTQGQFRKVYVMTDDVNIKGKRKNLYPTKRNIEKRIKAVVNFTRPQDMLVFFFSGHGVSDYEERGYLVPIDAEPDNKNEYSSYISVNWIVETIKKKKIKKFILILDACRETPAKTSKNAARNSIREKDFEESEVAATFYSTKAGFYSFEDPDSPYGVFTKYMVYGMEGRADYNHDKIVTFFEVEKYVVEGVKEWSMRMGKNQKPFTRIHLEKHGDLILTYTPNSRKKQKSIIDKPLPRSLVGFDYAFRSAALPGWGQYYGDRYYKASAYFLITAGLIGNFAAKRAIFKSTQNKLNSVPLIPYTFTENALLLNYLNVSAGQKDLLNAENNMFNAGYAIAGFWVFNVFDAFIFKSAYTNPLKISIAPKFERGFYASSGLGSPGGIKFRLKWRF